MIKCDTCYGFGYSKGGPNGPWDKVDCTACDGTGKVAELPTSIPVGHPDTLGPEWFWLETTDLDESSAYIRHVYRGPHNQLWACEEGPGFCTWYRVTSRSVVVYDPV